MCRWEVIHDLYAVLVGHQWSDKFVDQEGIWGKWQHEWKKGLRRLKELEFFGQNKRTQ